MKHYTEASIFRGDLSKVFVGPMPFKDQNGKTIGTVVSVRFDGEYTVASIETDDIKAFQKANMRDVGKAIIAGD